MTIRIRCGRRYTTHLRSANRHRGSPGPHPPGVLPGFSLLFFHSVLFPEATQLKTVRTATAVLRVDPIVAEVQEVGTGARNRRRPAVPVVADGD